MHDGKDDGRNNILRHFFVRGFNAIFELLEGEEIERKKSKMEQQIICNLLLKAALGC